MGTCAVVSYHRPVFNLIPTKMTRICYDEFGNPLSTENPLNFKVSPAP